MAPPTSKPPQVTPLHDLFCGALAGLSARTVVAPLDVLKIRFQVQSEARGLYNYTSMSAAVRTIIATEGPRALWKGNLSAMLMVTPYAAFQLASFYQLKQAALVPFPDPYASLTIGAISAAVATVSTYPLDLLRTRFAAQSEPKRYTTLSDALTQIYAHAGLRGFYAGLHPTMVEIVPYIALHFAIYEHLKQRILKSDPHAPHLKTHQSLLVGAASGTASKFLILPLDNAKKIMQVEAHFAHPDTSRPHYTGITHVLRTVWSRDGLRGWFRGTAPSLVKAAPNSAITFAVYEAAKRYVTS